MKDTDADQCKRTLNRCLQSSLKHITDKSQVINFIRVVVVTDRFHCNVNQSLCVSGLHAPETTTVSWTTFSQSWGVFGCWRSLWIHSSQKGVRFTRLVLVSPYGDKFNAILAQVMTCCLTAPSHYLNQWWIIIKDIVWHLHESNFTRRACEHNS